MFLLNHKMPKIARFFRRNFRHFSTSSIEKINSIQDSI